MKTIIIIPARYASTRLPAKPLAIIGGEPMIKRTYMQAKKSKLADQVVIATDHEEIYRVCESFGAEVVMTASDHATGTDRLVEVASKYEADFYINVQGDEPFVSPDDIDQVIEILHTNNQAQIATLCFAITAKEARDPNSVKVVFDENKRALYFSRSAIPYARDDAKPDYYKHMGLYGYTKKALFAYQNLPSSSLENSEKLEQLRYLQAGFAIYLGITTSSAPAVDTKECLAKAEAYLRGEPIATPKLENIKVVISDIDGVLSPAGLIYGANGEELKKFSVRDGLAIKVLQASGVHFAVISGRSSPILIRRLKDLGIDQAKLNIKDKKEAVGEILQALNLTSDQAIFVGDDTLDLPAFEVCGLSCAVNDAPDYIKSQADIVLSKDGGDGAIRELIEKILEAQNNLHLISTASGYYKIMEQVAQ